MNAIFTICAKNYLAHAKTLGYSVKKYAPDTDFFIILSDEIGSDNIYCDDFNVIESNSLGIESFYEMAFKYNVVEFSTAVKPYYIDILLSDKGYEKVLYLDPDTVLYDSPEYLWNRLDFSDALLTPHIIYPYINFEGATPEEELLFVGIYNLGFFGVKNSETGRHIVKWWCEKLKNQCYADKEDALHVDQKWMDFLPCLYGDKIEILKHPGVNVAFWNLHERKVQDNEDCYWVNDQKLILFHFSGLDPNKYSEISKKQTKFHFDKNPELVRIFTEYVEQLRLNDLNHLSSLSYIYNRFDNDIHVLSYQRRLFRILVENEGKEYKEPFSTGKGSFYELLLTNKLMVFEKDGKYNQLRKGLTNFDRKIYLLKKLLKILKSIIGIKYYYLLMKFLLIYSRFEKQTFLLRKK